MTRDRGVTVSFRKLNKRDRTILDEITDTEQAEPHWRPRTRKDCWTVERPCPFVGCRYHLFLEVSHNGMAVKINFPGMQPGDMSPECSCALDVANRGEHTLEQVGQMMNLTRERVRQIEELAIAEFAEDEGMENQL